MKKFLQTLVLVFATTMLHAQSTTPTTSDDVKVDKKATVESKCGFVADSTAKSSTGKSVDPFDAYIDCATQMDYKTVWEKLSDTQKDFLVERCMMFEIQNEMGATGEAAMSIADIQAYEKMIKTKCTCIKEGKVFNRTGMSGTCSEEKPKELQRDLFMYTMDQCTKHLDKVDNVCTKGATNGKSETPDAGVWEESCKNDLRYQCYQFLTIPSVFQEPVNPELNKCNFGDQTKIISQQCRSYCYQHNTCVIGEEGAFHSGGGGIGNSAIDPKFKNRKIGNVYLLRKLGMSSCVKGTSFGIESNGTKIVGANPETGEPGKKEYSLYADQSCYAEIAVQYKDPDCGWRPTCEPLPAQQSGQNIPRKGTSTITLRCDGTGVKNMGTNDPTGVYCEAKVPDENAPKVEGIEPLSVLPDDTKIITNVNSVDLISKFGPAKCNPGGNGSPKDYQPKDYRSENRGMGVQVHNGCQADFKVSVNWERKDCTLAGEKTSSDTCCQSLVWDQETKMCNSPNYEPAELEDAAKVKLVGESCKATFPQDARAIADKYMQELGAYDQMFTILNEKADEYFKTIQAERHKAKFDLKAIPPATDSTYDLIKKASEAFWTFKSDMIASRAAYIEATDILKAQLEEFVSIMGANDGKDMSEEQKAKLEKNVFNGSTVQEASTKLSVNMLNDLENAYTKSILADFDRFLIAMYDVEQIGMNIAWTCAHKENCGLNNWLIKNNNTADPGIIDYYLDPVFPLNIGPTGQLLPRIGGVSRVMIPQASMPTFEKALSEKETLRNFVDYSDVSVKELTQESGKEARALQLFRRFSTEFPLRKDSLMNGSEAAKYLEAEINKENKTHLPYYCKAQEDGFEIRTPIGKALEPMRILQVASLLRTYFEEANRGVVGQKPCLAVATEYGNASGVGKTGGGASTVTGSSTGISAETAKLLSAVPNLGANTSFGAALANLGLVNAGKALETSDSANSSALGSGSVSDANKAGNAQAISFKKYKDDKKKKQMAAIDKRKKTHNDKLIGKYVKSMPATIGKSLKARELSSLGKGLFTGSGSGSLNSGTSATGTTNSTSGSAYGSNSGSGYGSGSYGSYGTSGSRSGTSGSATGNGQGTASNSDQNVLQNAINNRDSSGGSDKYKANEDDSIFEVITKAYIRNYDKVNKEKLDK